MAYDYRAELARADGLVSIKRDLAAADAAFAAVEDWSRCRDPLVTFQAHCNRGALLLELARPAEACSAFERAVRGGVVFQV